MAVDTVVRARISGAVKREATQVLEEMGLSVSDAIRLMLTRIAREKALPFEVRMPNRETLSAMAELEAGKGHAAADVAGLLASLNAED